MENQSKPMTDLIQWRAVDIVNALKAEKLTPHDLLDALEARIGAVDPQVNALPILCFDRARREADRLMKLPVAERGILCGLPVPIKDLDDVKGVRTSFGSVPFADNVATENCYMVDRLEREGAIVYAKSNTPEFGAGGNTFNDVHGVTRNPHNLDMSAAGSSGGAAAALASGTAWLAQGSDNAGSLRSPASFCGIVGFRPTPGLVVRGPSAHPYQTLLSNGPMARNIEDTALFLDAMAGQDMRDPLSLPPSNTSYLTAAQSRKKPVKVAFSADLGITPVDPEIAEICHRAALRFQDMGVTIEEAAPDFSGVHECYQTIRAHEFSLSMNGMSDENMAKLKPELADNLEIGRRQSFDDIAKATQTRGLIRNRVLKFFETYDLLLVPTTIVGPYPIEQRFVAACNGHAFKTYIDWLAIAYAITLVSLPALSLPCGFTCAGLPVGLQMVGRPRGEHALLASALILEDALGLDLRPIKPKPERKPHDEIHRQ
jgi:amidase